MTRELPTRPRRGMPPKGTAKELAILPTEVLLECLMRGAQCPTPPMFCAIEAPGGGGDARTFRMDAISAELQARDELN